MRPLRRALATLCALALLTATLAGSTAAYRHPAAEVLVYGGPELKQVLERLGVEPVQEYEQFTQAALSPAQQEALRAAGYMVQTLQTNAAVLLGHGLAGANTGLPATPATVRRSYVVRFAGPIRPEWTDRLEAVGAQVMGYAPHFAVIARMDPATAAQVRRLPGVVWTADLGPLAKLAPGLAGGRAVVEFFPGAAEGADHLRRAGLLVESVSAGRAVVRGDRSAFQRAAMLDGVAWVEPWIEPRLLNGAARNIIRADTLHARSMDGTGQVVAVTDTGVYKGHEAFAGNRVLGVLDFAGDSRFAGGDGHGHGTHVAASVLGDAPPRGRHNGSDGQAFGAELIDAKVFNNRAVWAAGHDLVSIWDRAYQLGARINSNSWGTDARGQYLSFDRDADRVTFEHKDYVLVVAAGNAGPGMNTVGSPGGAKNVITVGAAATASPEAMAWFSSRGPTDDGRIKPDLIAPGAPILSARAGSATGYVGMQGTSMATPQVSGAAALARSYYEGGHYARSPWLSAGSAATGPLRPSAALIKATLINGAVEMQSLTGEPVSEKRFPNNLQGWGRIDLARSLPEKGGDRTTVVWDVPAAPGTGQVWKTAFQVNGSSKELKLTLVWTDAPASPGAQVALVNDLDLRVTAPDGRVFVGNHFTGRNPGYSLPGGSFDSRNTVEGVRLLPGLSFAGTLPRGEYQVEVIGKNVPAPGSNFALVAGADHDTAAPPPKQGPPPEPVRADADGVRVMIMFSEPLDSRSVPSPADFAVLADEQRLAAASVAVEGTAVTLRLAAPADPGTRVSVGYVPGRVPLRSSSGTRVEPFGSYEAENLSSQPVLQAAAADGTGVSLAYSKLLDPGAMPAPGDFHVSQGGAGRVPVNRVGIQGALVDLVLAEPLAEGSSVAVTYLPGAVPLRDLAGNRAAPVDGYPASNHSVAPRLKAATVEAAAVVLTYSEALDHGSVPPAQAYLIQVEGDLVSMPLRVVVEGSEVRLTLRSRVGAGRTVNLTYRPVGPPVQDSRGNRAEAFEGQVVKNTAEPPRLVSAEADGARVVLAFSRPLDPRAGEAGDFLVTVPGTAPIAATRMAMEGERITLTLARGVRPGDALRLTYRPGRWPVRDLLGEEIAPLAGAAVTNVSRSPMLLEAEAEGAQLTLKYDKELSAAAVPAPSAFRVESAGRQVTVVHVRIARDRALLALAAPAHAGQALSVSYLPGSPPLQDLAGNSVPAFEGRQVKVLSSALELKGSALYGNLVILTFSSPLDVRSVPLPTDFVLTVNGQWAGYPVRVLVAGYQVRVYLNRTIRPGERAALTYTPGVRPIRDTFGNPAGALRHHPL